MTTCPRVLRDKFREAKKERMEASALAERLRTKVFMVVMMVVVMVVMMEMIVVLVMIVVMVVIEPRRCQVGTGGVAQDEMSKSQM